MIDMLNSLGEAWWSWMRPMFWQVFLLGAVVWAIDLALRRRRWAQVRHAVGPLAPHRPQPALSRAHHLAPPGPAVRLRLRPGHGPDVVGGDHKLVHPVDLVLGRARVEVVAEENEAQVHLPVVGVTRRYVSEVTAKFAVDP